MRVIAPSLLIIVIACTICKATLAFVPQSDTKSLKNLTSSPYQQAYVSQKSLGYRPFDAKVRVEKDVAYFDIEFEKAKPVSGFVAKHDIDENRFEEIARDLKAKRYNLTCHKTYRVKGRNLHLAYCCLLYTSPSPRDRG